MRLLEPSHPSFSLSYTTGASGAYNFDNLQPGVYTVETPVLSKIFQSGRSEFGGFVDGSGNTTLAGSDYGAAATSGGMYLVSGITIQEGYGAVDYNFLESALRPDQTSMRLFLASAASGLTYWVNGPVQVVPEPGTLALLGAAAIAGGLLVRRWRKSK